MNCVQVAMREGIAELTLGRGKVNALDESAVEELRQRFQDLADDTGVKAVILTGQGNKFFSFGFDIPEFLTYSKPEFIRYVQKFTSLCTYLFTYPKPLIAALNGHTIAGGCMLALVCDYRLMVSGKAKIGLNEITFGSAIFAGSVRILKFAVGERNAQTIATTGAMYSSAEALQLGLVDQLSSDETLLADARAVALGFAAKPAPAFATVKRLLRTPPVKEIRDEEERSISEFADIWYSDATWKNLQAIKIHS